MTCCRPQECQTSTQQAWLLCSSYESLSPPQPEAVVLPCLLHRHVPLITGRLKCFSARPFLLYHRPSPAGVFCANSERFVFAASAASVVACMMGCSDCCLGSKTLTCSSKVCASSVTHHGGSFPCEPGDCSGRRPCRHVRRQHRG